MAFHYKPKRKQALWKQAAASLANPDEERRMQQVLFDWCLKRKHWMVIPNFQLYHEADVVSLTDDRMVYEYEIKASLADFKADFNKTVKHELMRAGDARSPNFFYYAMSEELADKIGSVPSHAGLVRVGPVFCEVVKKAPQLHSQPISEEVQRRALRSMMFRFWKARQ